MVLLKSLKLVTLIKSLFCIDGESEETIKKFQIYIENNAIVIFSFSHCPICQKAERLVQEKLGIQPAMVDMYERKNTIDIPSPIHKHIGHLIGSDKELPPLPQIWANKEYVGSFEALRKAMNSNKLTKEMFAESSQSQTATGPLKKEQPHAQFTFDI
mmetsp:Transcript_13465/g.22756  ORF Transcript_13465/g.22756 Transcript_13465/m.22756 type:complete len:157 (+) Transcript_13465:325-795(+)